jgi:myosin heavy subunit
MRCAGLMEAVRIRKAGFDIRINHDEFFKKYRFISVPGVPNLLKG